MKLSLFSLGIFAASISAYTRSRPPCRENDDYRCFEQSTAVATPFCSSWISIPMVTITVAGYIATETPAAQSQEPAPQCLVTTSLSPYARRLIENACICLSVPTATTTVAASTFEKVASTTEVTNTIEVTSTTEVTNTIDKIATTTDEVASTTEEATRTNGEFPRTTQAVGSIGINY